MNDQEIMERLIFIGHTIEINSEVPDELINSLKPCGHINLSVWLTLDRMERLTQLELIELLKAMVFLERELHWTHGSVSSTQSLLPIIISRGVDNDKVVEIASWVIRNTNSIYVSCMAKKILNGNRVSAYLCGYLNPYERRRYEPVYDMDGQLSDIEPLQPTQKEIDEQRKNRELSRKVAGERRKTDFRIELINKLNKMSICDQLILISNDETYPPNFYPTKCAASANIDVIKSIPTEKKRALVLKMKGGFRGPWGKFKKRLISVYGEDESNRLLGGDSQAYY